MITIVAALAYAACDVASAIPEVRDHGRREAYTCLMGAEEAASSLVRALFETPGDPRLSRALALWMLQRADTPFDPAHVERLAPADLRMLADGVRARRGRKSPVPEHDQVFTQFAWYRPVATYTDGRLKPGDREQIAMLDRPVPTSTAAAPPDPAAPGRAGDWWRALTERDGAALAQGAVPALLLLVGLGGAAWYVRRPAP
jgi:hypothetical protein